MPACFQAGNLAYIPIRPSQPPCLFSTSLLYSSPIVVCKTEKQKLSKKDKKWLVLQLRATSLWRSLAQMSTCCFVFFFPSTLAPATTSFSSRSPTVVLAEESVQGL
uniref:Uncharacterized protein n=1 Tax=Oryza brachyantha TaxID=4533 RepID=J3LG81_ORYBR